ncbi:PulJ/GspJ family protein [Candidatus Williamhamiltonella defendens]|nr:prepilin-type N-terminal cleavage/methylation domain-containing protein [Candidatus Hamiltonella defensa]
MRRKPLSDRFTLLELLTAISISSLMSFLAYALMDAVTRF